MDKFIFSETERQYLQDRASAALQSAEKVGVGVEARQAWAQIAIENGLIALREAEHDLMGMGIIERVEPKLEITV